jgi:hypothetical protein
VLGQRPDFLNLGDEGWGALFCERRLEVWIKKHVMAFPVSNEFDVSPAGRVLGGSKLRNLKVTVTSVVMLQHVVPQSKWNKNVVNTFHTAAKYGELKQTCVLCCERLDC